MAVGTTETIAGGAAAAGASPSFSGGEGFGSGGTPRAAGGLGRARRGLLTIMGGGRGLWEVRLGCRGSSGAALKALCALWEGFG